MTRLGLAGPLTNSLKEVFLALARMIYNIRRVSDLYPISHIFYQASNASAQSHRDSKSCVLAGSRHLRMAQNVVHMPISDCVLNQV